MIKKFRFRTNWLLAKLALRTGFNLSKPTYICAKMTMRCNSRCIHCDIWKIDYAEKEMSTGQWLKALDGLHDWLGDFPMIFTGGEALLRPDMITILRHASEQGIEVKLLTNGLMVDDELAYQIVTSGVSEVTLSYDGVNRSTHDLFRGGEGFHAATSAAIAAFARLRQTLNPRFRIILKTVISRNNLSELADIACFAESNSVRVRFQPIEENYAATPDSNWYLKSDLWIEDIELLKAQFATLKEMKIAGAAIDNSLGELDSYVRYFEQPEELMAAVQAHEVGIGHGGCSAAVSSFVISSNGDVRMCWMMEPIGNLTIQSPQEIWSKRSKCWREKCGFR